MTKLTTVTLAVLLALLASAVLAADETSRAVGAPGVTSPETYEIGDPVPRTRIAVMDLRVTGEYADEIKSWLPALIEDRLLQQGWTLVVRGQRLQNITAEHNLGNVKPGTGLPSNELLGATTFMELNARVQVKDIRGLVGYKYFTFGDYARASVDLNGQIVDPATGVLKSSITVGGSASGLKTGLVLHVGGDLRVGGAGYDLRGIRETLVGKAADEAATRLIEKLSASYPSMLHNPTVSQNPSPALQPASTTVSAVAAPQPTILLELPAGSNARQGDRYGIYRADQLVAEVEVVKVAGNRAEATILSQDEAIRPTDIARKMPIAIKAE